MRHTHRQVRQSCSLRHHHTYPYIIEEPRSECNHIFYFGYKTNLDREYVLTILNQRMNDKVFVTHVLPNPCKNTQDDASIVFFLGDYLLPNCLGVSLCPLP